MDNKKPSKAYHRRKNTLFFIGFFLDLLVLFALALSGASIALRDFAATRGSNFIFQNGIYIAVFITGLYLLHFPLRLYEDFTLEHAFGLSNQNFKAWLWDDFKKFLLNAVILILSVEVIYLFLKQFPETWWVGAGVFWLFLTLVLARLTPTIIIPIFYKYSSLENQELRERILRLFKESGIKVKDAYCVNFSLKTKKANAFICGLGKSRRVVLSDNLVRQFSIPEIEAVVAHEIGHYKHHDTFKLVMVNAAVVFLAFYLVHQFLIGLLPRFGLTALDDIAFFPIVALAFTVFGFLLMPLLNAYSRALEVAADRFSLTLTGRPPDFISMIKKLGEMNLADFEPNWLIEKIFYSHPPIQKRITFAEHFVTPS